MGEQEQALLLSALRLLLHSLPYGSMFNIISFGYKYVMMFPESVPIDEDTLDKAEKELKKRSSLNGTDILTPL